METSPVSRDCCPSVLFRNVDNARSLSNVFRQYRGICLVMREEPKGFHVEDECRWSSLSPQHACTNYRDAVISGVALVESATHCPSISTVTLCSIGDSWTLWSGDFWWPGDLLISISALSCADEPTYAVRVGLFSSPFTTQA